MKVIIRADSSFNIGTGHIMRGLVLATQFSDVTFVTRDLPGNINFKINDAGYKLEIISDNSVVEFEKVVNNISPDLVVIDNYDIDYTFEKILKDKYPNVSLMVLDDTYERHYCDILLNHNISTDEKKYKNLVLENCELRCGSEYILLRQEFYDYKVKPKQKNQVPKIFVAMGGADYSNISISILEVIEEIGGVYVNLVTTIANKNLDELREYCRDKKWINLHINSIEIARLMYESDFAIVTPSVTVNEVYFMQLPLIAIKTAENQSDIFEYLIKNGYDAVDGLSTGLLKKYIERHKQNVIVGYDLQDFVDLSQDDSLKILSWRNDPTVRNNMYNREKISAEDHLKFVKSLVACTNKKYFVVREYGHDIGVIDFTQIIHGDSLHMGLYAKPNVNGTGKILMNAIVEYAFKILKVKKIFAEVFEFNNKAYNLYLRYGFKKIGDKEVNNKKVICMVLRNEDR
ncbi:MAG: UDP-2,4-diacetamido-2,4,6-trideoxy-beta-L-altropyranose hydrolase [Francisella endosymbiont of Hyalomma asiaticum]